MRPILQTRAGAGGDCYLACIASILECDLESPPAYEARHLRGDGRPLGAQRAAPRGYAIVHHRLLDGSVHAAVCYDGEIVHDPSPRPFCTPEAPVLAWTVVRRTYAE